jgi:hypothetical protein
MNIDLAFTKKKVIIFAALVSVITFVFTMIFLFATQKPVEKEITYDEVDFSRMVKPEVYNFYLKEEPLLTLNPEYYLLRERMKKWSQEQVDTFWILPYDIIIDGIRQKNEQHIEEMLREIP